MKKLTPKRAAELKAQGIEQIASIVKSHYSSEYFKLASLDAILANGGKMPEGYVYNGFVHGARKNHIDWDKTIRWSQI